MGLKLSIASFVEDFTFLLLDTAELKNVVTGLLHRYPEKSVHDDDVNNGSNSDLLQLSIKLPVNASLRLLRNPPPLTNWGFLAFKSFPHTPHHTNKFTGERTLGFIGRRSDLPLVMEWM
eukprot:Lankesteria_metandrocarpae@DN11038_c0_g1_i1.p1